MISVNPNTMYPLLREMEASGLVEGRWELPDRRTRRYYSITPAGRREYRRLRGEVEPFLDSVIRSVTLMRSEIYGEEPTLDAAARAPARSRASPARDLRRAAGRGAADRGRFGLRLARRHLAEPNSLPRPTDPRRSPFMFVFKAAVVGGGTMGGEIAQAIASADIPVVVKDVEQKFVDHAPREGPRGDRRPARQARQEGEADPGAGRRPPRAR